MVFMHGNLLLTITAADGLRSGENYGLGFVGKCIAKTIRDKNDAFVNVLINGLKIVSTQAIDNESHPRWDETFHVALCHDVNHIIFDLKDRNVAGVSKLGSVNFPGMQLMESPDRKISGKFEVQHPFKTKKKGTLILSMQYMPCSGVDTGPEVPNVYFQAEPGNHVYTYQDAHNYAGLFPAVEMPDGKYMEVRSCWTDMYHNLANAQTFIYMTGWSFHPDIQLIRDQPEYNETLGELLKRKALEGVKVHVMVWDDRSSIGWAGFAGLDAGMMGTHDELMRAYFRSTDVECALVGRTGGSSNTILEGQTAASCFTHHQKTVMCDADPMPGQSIRRVVGYVGGIDLTKGRYDTAKHDLFRTRESVHKDDYANVSTGDKKGYEPREPWEDIHSKIDGPAAHQLVVNFIQRWARQVRANAPLTPRELGLASPEDQAMHTPESFTVQVLRSIDERSCVFDDNKKSKLFAKKGRYVDHSIMQGYVHQIRRAKHFIFVENQYFLGSSFMWSEQSDAGCDHTIPAELAFKIATKIKNGERFAAYILTPLYPEGVTNSDAVQGILKFQHLTMEAMLKSVAAAIDTRKLLDPSFDAVPTDYLNFYCLGNRESSEGWVPPAAPAVEPVEGEVGYLSYKNRRFMIYVHSKLMITDDEHCIIGSANVNMRSMAGTRDSEIAAGFWQPHHLADARSTPAGHIFGFRMSIWSEHLNSSDPTFRHPSSLECVRRVNELARANWDLFMGETNVEMSAHLMPYPIHVFSDGSIRPADAIFDGQNGTIPDFPAASMTGKKVPLPYVLTT